MSVAICLRLARNRRRPMKRPAAFSAASAPDTVEDESETHNKDADMNLPDLPVPAKKPRRSKAGSATQPSKGKQAEPKAKAKAKCKPKAAPKAKASQELGKKRKNAAMVPWTRPSGRNLDA